MKHYYRIGDAAAHTTLLAIWLYALLTSASWLNGFYFIAVGWFIVSLAIHFIISTQKFQKIYRRYAFVCIVLVVLPLYGLIVWYILLAEIVLLPVILPAMLLLYTCSCIAEILYVRKRPISYLK